VRRQQVGEILVAVERFARASTGCRHVMLTMQG
jgi:hypothetical protein